VRECPDNHRRRADGGNDLQVAVTLRAVFEVEVEHAPEQARPSGKKRIHTYSLEDLSRQFASGNRCHDVCLYVWL
jgi:hypothetical protein